MPTTRFTVHTALPPTAVMDLFTDFGPARASHWPNVSESRFEVHDQGPDWAEVTEGMDVVEKIGGIQADPSSGMPAAPVIIKSITVEAS